MKTKFTLLAVLIVISSANLFGQERVNRVELHFQSSSDKLIKATGWDYNSTLGEWINYKNVINDDKDFKGKYKMLQGAYMMSRTNQNFISIQTKTVTYKGIKYYVLIVKKWQGEYEYPYIQEDWYEYKSTEGYIFKENEYNKLKNINSLIVLKTKHKVSIGSKYEKYNEQKFLDLIQTELSSKQDDFSIVYKFPILKSKEGAIRFCVPDYFTSSDPTYNFDKRYFETDSSNFFKIIIKEPAHNIGS